METINPFERSGWRPKTHPLQHGLLKTSGGGFGRSLLFYCEVHMVSQSFKERVRQTAIAQAKVYYQVFLKYEYLVCSEAFSEKPYYIISAHADNFKHLIGVNTVDSAEVFFHKCLNGTLTEDDFDFCKQSQSEKEVKGAVRDKIKAFPNFLSMMECPLMAEESFVKNRVRCSFATTDHSVTVGFIAANKSKPMTLLRGDRLDTSKSRPVDLVFRRAHGAQLFDEIVFGDLHTIAKYRSNIGSLLSDKYRHPNLS